MSASLEARATAWARRFNDRVVMLAAAVGLVWLAIYAALTALSQGSAELASFVANVAYLVPVAAATVLSGYAARRTHGSVRRAWQLFLVSNALWLAGEVVWSLYAYLTPDGAPTPSLAEVGYILSYAVALPAILVGLGVRGALGNARGVLDALLVAIGVGAIGWQLVIGPLVPGSWDAATATNFTISLLSVGIVSVLAAVLISRRRSVPLSILIAGLSYGVGAASDAAYTYLVILGSYSDASWLNLGWQVEAVVIAVAAVVAVRTSEGYEQRPRLDRDAAVLPTLVAAVTVGVLALTDLARIGTLSNVTLAVTMVLFLGLLLRQVIVTHDRTRLAEQLHVAAITDPLTGLYNRRFFEEMLRSEANRATRLRTPLSLILLDLDHFKRINDAFGHAAGDAVLIEAATRLRRSLRASDLVARHGGEEFVCLLPGTEEDAAVDLAEHVRWSLSRAPVPIPGGPEVVLTASFGVATMDPADGAVDVARLVNAADTAAYEAKARGRNRVVGSARSSQLEADGDRALPSELIWLVEQIDAMLGDHEHSAAVARWSMATGARLGLDDGAQRRAAAAARLHDIGKIMISRTVLTKPSQLDPTEWDEMRRHPAEGARLLVDLGNRPDLAALVAAHHERYDGCGYPAGLAGAEIPIEARIIAVCDAWATMRGHRPYARALSLREAREQILLGRGGQFDPDVADTFLALVDDGIIDEPALLRRTGDRSARALHERVAEEAKAA